MQPPSIIYPFSRLLIQNWVCFSVPRFIGWTFVCIMGKCGWRTWPILMSWIISVWRHFQTSIRHIFPNRSHTKIIWPQTLTPREGQYLPETYTQSPCTLTLDSLEMINSQPLNLEALNVCLTWLGTWNPVAQLLVITIMTGIVDILGGISVAWCVLTPL